MSNHSTHAQHHRPPMPCPEWCTEERSHGIWPDAGGNVFRLHRGRALLPADGVEVELSWCQLWHPDEGSCECLPMVRLTGMDGERELTANDARWLAYAILSAADGMDAGERHTLRVPVMAR